MGFLARTRTDAAHEIVAHADTRASAMLRQLEPAPRIAVFGQIYIVGDYRHRLVGVAIYDGHNDDFLIARVGRDEWADEQRRQNEKQKARRARARAREATP